MVLVEWVIVCNFVILNVFDCCGFLCSFLAVVFWVVVLGCLVVAVGGLWMWGSLCWWVFLLFWIFGFRSDALRRSVRAGGF